jgi:ABC-type sugar transport system ATPase subunit
MLGPSGTGKSVFLKTLVGLLKPEKGSIWINDRDLTTLREHDLYEVRKLFGVLFQDGALFGSMNLYDNIVFRCANTRRRPRQRSGRLSARRSSWSDCRVPRPSYRARSQVACASGPAWPAPWCSTPRSSSSTSRTPVSTLFAPATSTS